MLYVWAALLAVVNLVWLALVLFLLPGNWLMVLTTLLVAWWQWGHHMFSIPTLAAIVLLAATGDVVELLSGQVGSRRAGGSRWGCAGAFLGAVVGAPIGTILIPIPILGTLIGLGGGACLGAWLLELLGGKEMKRAAIVGAGAGVGQMLGTSTKFAIGIAIWTIVAVAAFWP